ncbi:MAG: vWA domain-containing protein [Vicinamibacterales bacterium]
MTDLTFRQIDWLWVAVPALVAALLWRWRVRRTFVGLSTADWIHRLGHRPSRLRRLPAVAVGVAIVLLVIALLDPVVPYSEAQVSSKGLDIVLVVDLSSSMQEVMGLARPPQTMANLTFTSRDNTPRRLAGKTRLETTKEALKDLIGRRQGDRLGLVVFSDNAYLVSPLTFDHYNLFKYVDMLDDQILRGEGMTAIGDGIGLATQLLARQSPAEGGHKLIVVFTDGENNTGRDPGKALSEADAAGIRFHVIGIDLEEEIKKKPAVLQLISTVRRLGGQYFNADTAGELRTAYGRIDAMERGQLTSRVAVHSEPAFATFARPAAVLLLLAIALRAIPFFGDLT